MIDKLRAWAAGQGRLAVLGMAELSESGRFISGLKESGQLDGRLFRTYLAGLARSASTPEPRWRSVILLSCPRPAHRLTFARESTPFTSLIPPTYVEYRRLSSKLLRDLKASMGPDFPATAILRAPLKRLAVRSGLASYGRNNITYSGEYGSYHQLVAFISEAGLEPFCEGGPAEGQQLAACARCAACATRCPTRAIDKGRFLLHAERCLTLFTENPGTLPPVRDKLSSGTPCIVGCLECQAICPANRGKLKIEPAAVSFTAAETRRFLADEGKRRDHGRRSDPAWQGIREKLKSIGMLHYQDRIGRNLRFLMNSGEAK